MNLIILFILSALPVVFLATFIYMKDKNKEPTKFLLKLFFGGFLSVIITLVLSIILKIIVPIFRLGTDKLNLIELVFYAFINVALVEEFAKWIITYNFSYNDDNLDEVYDMIVYSVFVALGFAFIENILYVFEGGIGTGIIRALLAVPGHACDGAIMGYYLGLAKLSEINNNFRLKKKNRIFSILVPTVMHGIYDYCLFTGKILFIIIFCIFVFIVYIVTLKRIKRLSSVKRKMKYKDNYCGECGIKVNSNYCPVCGRKNK